MLFWQIGGTKSLSIHRYAYFQMSTQFKESFQKSTLHYNSLPWQPAYYEFLRMQSWERLQHGNQDTKYLAVWLIVRITSVEDQVVSPSLVCPEQIVAHNLLQLPEPQVSSHWKMPIRQRYWYSWAGQTYSKLAPVLHKYLCMCPSSPARNRWVFNNIEKWGKSRCWDISKSIRRMASCSKSTACDFHCQTHFLTSRRAQVVKSWQALLKVMQLQLHLLKTSHLSLHQDYMDNMASW